MCIIVFKKIDSKNYIAKNRDKSIKTNISIIHELLDNVPELGIPTLENLCLFIANKLKNINVCEVTVERKALGDKCTLVVK